MQTNKLLVSGNGKFMSAGFILPVIFLVISIVAFTSGVDLSDNWSRQDQTMGTIMIIVGVFLFLSAGINAGRTLLSIRTSISVYEDVVKGSGLISQFSAPQEFSVSISDIRNVDVLKNTGIVVQTQYAKYTCYMKNAEEVRSKIMELVNAQ